MNTDMTRNESCPVCHIKRIGNYQWCPKCGTKAYEPVQRMKRKAVDYDRCLDCRWFSETNPQGWKGYGMCVKPDRTFQSRTAPFKVRSNRACKTHFERKENGE